MTFGERIVYLLKEKGMLQQELAERAGVTEAAVSHYIKGDRMPRASVLTRIADALETTTDYLMNGVDNDSKNEVGYARKLIARNASKMTKEEKLEIMRILLGEE